MVRHSLRYVMEKDKKQCLDMMVSFLADLCYDNKQRYEQSSIPERRKSKNDGSRKLFS